jgi:glycogen debranching enzyme
VLKVNALTPEGEIVHRWTTPDRWPHRDMWLWDSAFHAPAYAHLDPAWGQEALLAVLGAQYEDGFIAHQMSPERTSGITQPPVLAWACWQVYGVTGDRAFLAQAYPALCGYLEWDLDNRDWNGDGLLGWFIEGNPLCRSGESGMDNSPRFDPDGPWDNVDFCSYAVSDMRAVALIARELGREGEAEEWEERAREMGARMNGLLWDEESGFYYDRSPGGLYRLKSNAGFLPLFAGVASDAQAAELVEHLAAPDEFWSPLPVPTVALDEPSYAPDMWRGPTWININNLIRIGLEQYGYYELSQAIRRRTLDEIARWYEETGCLYEYYDCQAETAPYLLDRKGAPGVRGGTGFGVIADYNWTAAWTLLMLLQE